MRTCERCGGRMRPFVARRTVDGQRVCEGCAGASRMAGVRRSAGFKSLAALENPIHKQTGKHPEEWFHGSPHDFEHFGDPANFYDQNYEEDTDRYSHWNTLVGNHFTADHNVAKDFSGGDHTHSDDMPDDLDHQGPLGHVIHVKLHLKNPKVYTTEHDMDQEVYEHEWENGNRISKHIGSPPEDDDDYDEWADENRSRRIYADDAERKYGPDVLDPGFAHGFHPKATGWLNVHPDKEGIARRYKERMKRAGYDGVVYGNTYEGGGKSAIAFEPHQIEITQHHYGEQGCLHPDEAKRRAVHPDQQVLPGLEDVKRKLPKETRPDTSKHWPTTWTPSFFDNKKATGARRPQRHDTGRLWAPLPQECWDRYHGRQGDAQRRTAAMGDPTDWDAHYDPGMEVHRGMVVKVPYKLYDKLHGGPVHEAAAELAERTAKRASTGMHWSADLEQARDFPTRNVAQGSTVPVILHAQVPAREGIETRPSMLRRNQVFPHDHWEREVPLRKGTGVDVFGISWKPDRAHPHADEHGWVRHDFTAPVQHTAAYTMRYTTMGPRGYEDVEREIEGPFYRGGRRKYEKGDHFETGHKGNTWGEDAGQPAQHVYFTNDLDTAIDYARQFPGGGHVHEVEPTGEIKPDHHESDFKTKHPVRVVRHVPRSEWPEWARKTSKTAAEETDEERRARIMRIREERKKRRGTPLHKEVDENGVVHYRTKQPDFSDFFTPIPEEELKAQRERAKPKPEPIDDHTYSLDDVSRKYGWEGFGEHEISHLVHRPERAMFSHEDVPVHSLRLTGEDGRLKPAKTHQEIADQGEDEQERLEGLKQGYDQGDAIPPIVVVRHGEHHIIADGSHRAAIAAERGDTHIPAFVTERTKFGKTATFDHDVYYHITDNPKFELDPQYKPERNTTFGGDMKPGVFLTHSPETWVNTHGYIRPWVAEIHAPKDIENHSGVIAGGYNSEKYVPAEHYDKLKVHRVIPLDAQAREKYSDHGWMEEALGSEFDTGNKIPQKRTRDDFYSFQGYHYPGPDAREMTPAQIKHHHDRYKRYMKQEKGWADEDLSHIAALGEESARQHAGQQDVYAVRSGNSMVNLCAHHRDVHVGNASAADALGDQLGLSGRERSAESLGEARKGSCAACNRDTSYQLKLLTPGWVQNAMDSRTRRRPNKPLRTRPLPTLKQSENSMAGKLYHISPRKHRESIQQQGLTRAISRGGKYYLASDPDEMIADLNQGTASDFSGHDVWEVDAQGLKLHDDPESPGSWGAVYTRQQIGPERLRLRKSEGVAEKNLRQSESIRRAIKGSLFYADTGYGSGVRFHPDGTPQNMGDHTVPAGAEVHHDENEAWNKAIEHWKNGASYFPRVYVLHQPKHEDGRLTHEAEASELDYDHTRHPALRSPNEEPHEPIMYHGTTRHEDDDDPEEITPSGGSQSFGPGVADPDYAYATPSLDDAWTYAHKRAENGAGGKPTVYRVTPHKPEDVEEDPKFEGEYSRGNYEHDKRSKSGFEVLDEVPMSQKQEHEWRHSPFNNEAENEDYGDEDDHHYASLKTLAEWDGEDDKPEWCEECGEEHTPDEGHRECAACGERHEDYEDKDRHESTMTDWDDVYPRLNSHVHRVLPHMTLPDHVHEVVHDESRPMAERGEALLKHVEDEHGHGLGMHWSDVFGEGRGHGADKFAGVGGGDERDTQVVLHARKPDRDDIETDPDTLDEHQVYGYDAHDENEVPIQQRAPVHITGVSWRPGGYHQEWRHHNVKEPIEMTAKRLPTLRMLAHDATENEALRHCFTGDTRYLTVEGVKSLAETVGTVQRVLTGTRSAVHSGRWVEAMIHDFGEQPVLRVTLKRNKRTKVIRATAEHRWLVRRPDRIVLTQHLRPGHRLAHLRAPFFEGDPDREGIRMGAVFGDGYIARQAGRTYGGITLWGAKRDLAKYFDDVAASEPRPYVTESGVQGLRYQSGMAGYTKQLPELTESLSYLRGWLMGYFATDGHVSAQGQVTLSSASLETLLHVRDVANLLGIGTYAPTSKLRRGYGAEPTLIHEMGFSATDLSPSFFLRDDQRAAWRLPAQERFGWTVVSVEDHGETETVYCPRVPETESFVLEDNIHTMNCPFCGAGKIIGRADGSVECEFCHHCFTVQVQPQYPNFPQTINGVPQQIPGMPGQVETPSGPGMGGGGFPPGEEDPGMGGGPPWAQDGAEDDEAGAVEEAEDDESADDEAPPFAKQSSLPVFRTATGAVLTEDDYVRHLAIRTAKDRSAMIARIRAERQGA